MFKRRSLAFKQSFYVLFSVVTITAVLTVFMARQLWGVLTNNIETATITAARAAANELDQTFREAQRGVKQLALFLENTHPDEAVMRRILSETFDVMCREISGVYGGSIAFKPGAYDPSTRYFMLYSWVSSGALKTERIGGRDYEYFHKTWFTLPEHLGKAVWTEPYFDEGAGDILMTTYSVPFYRVDADGKREFMGVVTLDLSLSWLRKLVDGISLFDSGYAFIISKFGRIISHPDPGLIMNASIFSMAEEMEAPEMREIGRRMLAGNSGFIPYQYSLVYDKKAWLTYVPLQSNDWVVAIVFPHEKLFATLRRVQLKGVLLSVCGFLLVLTVVIVITRKVTGPLRHLTRATEIIGGGDFHVKLPPITTDDEIGILSRSFERMQRELVNYIEELKTTTAAKEKIESELHIAHQIQQGILPQLRPPFPDCPEFSLCAKLDSARAVGGDLYDFFFLDKTHLCFVVGDVSGKGVPASLFMAVTQTLHRSIAAVGMSTGEMVTKISTALEKGNEMLMFVTYYMCVLDTLTGEIEFTNAGHNPPFILRRNGSLEKVEKLHGPPIAVSPAVYSSERMTLKSGDTLLLYTDGVTEAFDVNGNAFGEERLTQLLTEECMESTPQQIIEAIDGAVEQFTSGAEQSDDITLLALHKN